MSFSDTGASGPSHSPATGSTTAAPGARLPNGIYQNGRCVAEAIDAQVDSQAREIGFAEICQSDDLLIPEDCEYREYRILIQKVGFASRQQTGAAHKGRVLKTVVAEILGYREQ